MLRRLTFADIICVFLFITGETSRNFKMLIKYLMFMVEEEENIAKLAKIWQNYQNNPS